MGVKFLALIVLLAVSVSVRSQDVISDNERTISEVDNSNDALINEEIKEEVKEESPVEVLTDTEELQVRSGKYQMLEDGLIGDGPVDTDAVNFDPDNAGESQRQLLAPSTTAPTFGGNEYGKWKRLL